jgi:SPP1 family predicted phage head-tail adaptor
MKNPGRLSEFIDIRRASITFDDYGQPITSSTSDEQVWCEVIHPGGGNESVKAAQVFPERTVTFLVRHPNPTAAEDGDTFNESDTVIYQDIEHDIIAIVPVGRRDGLRIVCKRKGTHDV